MEGLIEDDASVIEFIAPVFSFPAIAIYHAALFMEVLVSPFRTSIGQNIHERKFWAIKMLTKDGNEILGVQGIRNGLLTATLLASVSVAIVFGILQTAIPLRNTNDIPLKQFYISLLLVGINMLAFVFLSLAVRAAHHISFAVCCHIFKSEQWYYEEFKIPPAPPQYQRTLDQKLSTG